MDVQGGEGLRAGVRGVCEVQVIDVYGEGVSRGGVRKQKPTWD